VTSLTFVVTALIVFGLLLFTGFAKATLWRATVTPLASIMGSGFLVSAPLLAREFGGYAAPAMALLIIVAALIGWVIQYNIRVVEPQLKSGSDKALRSIEEISHVVLTFAYFISVAYYLSLLGHFVLQSVGVQNEQLATVISILLITGLGILGWIGGAEKVAEIERYTTALNLAVICGFLLALVVFGAGLIANGTTIRPPAGRLNAASLPLLLGLLIVVQGFETSRFLGSHYDAETRIRSMKIAQLVSGVIYIVFFLLLSPLLGELAKTKGVAGIITISGLVAIALPAALTVAAVASQFSAAVADSIGNEGLIGQLSRGKIDPKHAYALVAVVAVVILITQDVNSVIALASRAFALFYALQCLVAWEAARKRQDDIGKSRVFLALSILTTAVCIFGVPFE
jgi:hypothetical protein